MTRRTISGDVKRQLAEIAKHGRPPKWLGFDDADIHWFLHRWKHKTGPYFSDLRDTYDNAMQEAAQAEWCLLAFFPIDQKTAKGLLAEISGRRP